jgi:outer membrane protein assembly factor BamE (lipoprotein component of BamABCDE complex)
MVTKIVIGIAIAQFLVIALFSAFSRMRFPKKGLRRSEKLLLGSALVLGLSWVSLLDVKSLWQGEKKTVQASAMSNSTGASCASVEVGMKRDEVTKRLGDPDESRNNEETRGPGAEVLVYKGSQCAVHVFNGKVEFVD